jgi:hypothetical protein
MDSSKTDGSAGPGIYLVGAIGGAPGSPVELASGCQLINNTLRGYGNDVTGGSSGAMYCQDTRGALVGFNTIIEPNPIGLCFHLDNYDYSCIYNLIVDVWNSGAIGKAIAIEGANSTFNTGRVIGNELKHGTKIAAVLNNKGLSTVSSTGCNIIDKGNDFNAATIPYAAGANQTVYLDAEVIDGFALDNIAGTVGDTEVQRNGLAAGAGRFRPARPGSVVGTIISATEARTAGTLTLKTFKNTGLAGAAGAQLGTTINTLSASPTSERLIPIPRGEQVFAAFDEVYVTYTTTGWTPITSDLRVALLVVYD